MIEVKVPELGENIEQADVSSVLVHEGDSVERDQAILELSTDKASFELPSSHAGVVKTVHVKPGDSVSVGQVAISLDDGDRGEREAAEPEPREAAEPEPRKAAEPEPRETAEPERKPVLEESEIAPSALAKHEPESESEPEKPTAPAAGPATRRLARELGVDLGKVRPREDEVITRADVRAHADAPRRAPEPQRRAPELGLPDFQQWGEVAREPMTRLARATAENVTRSWQTIPHVTQHELIDVTELERARRQYQASRSEDDPALTMTVLAIKAAVAALKVFPRFNASLDMDAGELVCKRYYNIGVAVDTEHGLLVPVVRDADRKTTRELADSLDSLARRARVRALWPAEMQGGTFTITNLGGLGGTSFTPVIRFPEVAILGLSRVRTENQLRDGEAVETRLLPVSLSYDHRVVNGADAVRFIRAMAASLATPLSLLIDS